MVGLLLKVVFFVISIISNVIIKLIFSFIAYFLFLIIQAFKVPGEAIQGALEQLAEAMRACAEYILQLVMKAIGSLISSAFDHFIQAVIESAVNSGLTIGGLMEQTRDSFDGVLKTLPEILEGVGEFVSTIVSDICQNYNDAVRYFSEND